MLSGVVLVRDEHLQHIEVIFNNKIVEDNLSELIQLLESKKEKLILNFKNLKNKVFLKIFNKLTRWIVRNEKQITFAEHCYPKKDFLLMSIHTNCNKENLNPIPNSKVSSFYKRLMFNL